MLNLVARQNVSSYEVKKIGVAIGYEAQNSIFLARPLFFTATPCTLLPVLPAPLRLPITPCTSETLPLTCLMIQTQVLHWEKGKDDKVRLFFYEIHPCDRVFRAWFCILYKELVSAEQKLRCCLESGWLISLNDVLCPATIKSGQIMLHQRGFPYLLVMAKENWEDFLLDQTLGGGSSWPLAYLTHSVHRDYSD